MALQVGELFASLRLDNDQFNSGLGRAEADFGGMGGRLMGIATKYAALLGGAITAGLSVKTGVEYNAMQEQSTVAWTTLLGSATKAKDMLQRISDFAKATPFETADVDMMAKYLNNAGLAGDGLFKQLMKVSDTASAFAIPAADAKELTRQMSQVQQAGVAYTEDLNILQDRGVPIYKAVASQLGVNVAAVKKMASEGKISSDIYMKAFNGIADGVKGASDAQSKTFSGMISTIKDSFDILAGALTKPIFDLLKNGLSGAAGALSAFVSLARGDTKGFQQAMTDAFGPGVANMISGLAGKFGPMIDAVSNGMNVVKGVVKGAFAVLAGQGIQGVSILTALGLSPGVVVGITKTMASIRTNFIDTFQKVSGVLQAIFAIASGQGVKGVSILTALGLSPDTVVTITKLVATIRDAVTGFFGGYVKAITSLFTGKNDIGSSFMKIFGVVRDIALPILKDAMKFITSLIQQVQVFWAQHGAQIMQAIKNFWAVVAFIFKAIEPILMFIIKSIWENIKGVIQGAFNIIKGIILIFTGLFTGDFGLMWEGIKDVFSGAVEFLWNLMQLLFIGKIFGGIKAGFVAMIENVRSWGTAIKEIWTGAGDFLESISGKIITFVKDGFKSMGDYLANIWTWLRNVGMNVWNSIWGTIRLVISDIGSTIANGFRNAVDTAVSFFSNLPSRMWGVATSVFSVVKNMGSYVLDLLGWLAESALTWGWNIMIGLFNGLVNGAGNVYKKAAEIAGNIGRTISKALGINSPSRVTTELGMFTAKGLEVGMDNHISKIRDKAKEMAKAAIPAVNINDMLGDPAMAADKYSTQYKARIEVPVMIDGKEVARATTKYNNTNQYRNKRDELRARGLS